MTLRKACDELEQPGVSSGRRGEELVHDLLAQRIGKPLARVECRQRLQGAAACRSPGCQALQPQQLLGRNGPATDRHPRERPFERGAFIAVERPAPHRVAVQHARDGLRTVSRPQQEARHEDPRGDRDGGARSAPDGDRAGAAHGARRRCPAAIPPTAGSARRGAWLAAAVSGGTHALAIGTDPSALLAAVGLPVLLVAGLAYGAVAPLSRALHWITSAPNLPRPSGEASERAKPASGRESSAAARRA